MTFPQRSPEVDAYLATVPEPGRSTLQALREEVHRIVPDSGEKISYGCPAFTLNGKPFGGFAAFTKHLAWLPHSGSTLSELEDDLQGYQHTKSSLHFPPDQPLPRDLLEKLIRARLPASPGTTAPRQ